MPPAEWRYTFFVTLTKNVTHVDVVRFVHDVLSEYRKPKLTIGTSASKMEYDDIVSKREFTISQKQIDELYAKIDKFKIDGSVIYNSHYLEVPLQIGKWSFRDPVILDDAANGLIYQIGNPSSHYTLFIFDYVFNNISTLIRDEFHGAYPYVAEMSKIGESVIDFM